MKHFTRKQLREAFNRLSAKEPMTMGLVISCAAWYDSVLENGAAHEKKIDEEVTKTNEELRQEGLPETSKEKMALEVAKIAILTKDSGEHFSRKEMADIFYKRVFLSEDHYYGKDLTEDDARIIRVFECLYDVKAQAPKP